jgi:predicted component of type VI protein secretion system
MLTGSDQQMISRRFLLRWASYGAGALLWGCGSDDEEAPPPAPPPPAPTILSMTLEAAPDAGGVLGDDLIGEDVFTLAPGATQVYQRQFEEDARFLAIIAAYRNIDDVNWRGFVSVPPNRTTLLNAELNAAGLSLQEVTL